jgi:hypothetical protein
VQCVICGVARNCFKLRSPDIRGWEPLGYNKALLSESTRACWSGLVPGFGSCSDYRNFSSHPITSAEVSGLGML